MAQRYECVKLQDRLSDSSRKSSFKLDVNSALTKGVIYIIADFLLIRFLT